MNIIKKIFGQKNTPKEPPFIVTEGIRGNWHYHISREECPTRSLCNEKVMKTSLPLKSWGIVTHLKEKYCKECFKLYREIENG